MNTIGHVRKLITVIGLFSAIMSGCAGLPVDAVQVKENRGYPAPAGMASTAGMEDVIADMQLNEARLLNAPPGVVWSRKANIVMGSAARGDAAPTWWKPANTEYKSAKAWNAISPWFAIYPGVANTASNVRVKISAINVYLLSKSTNKWIRLDTGNGNPTWAANMGFNLSSHIGTATPRIEPDGALSYKLDRDFHPVHGGAGKYPLMISGSDIAAVFATLTSELILDDPNGVDDRAAAQILVSIGADYYPTQAANVRDYMPMTYCPPAAESRFGLVNTVPRTHYLATIDPPGPRSRTLSVYLQNGGMVALPVAQFAANPPPGINTTTPSTPAYH